VPVLHGLRSIPDGAQQLSDFVDKILKSTGASQVDIVGHSQGGMLPRYYVKFLGGAGKVNQLIGLAPNNHGTTLSGLLNLGKYFPGAEDVLKQGFPPGCLDQQVGSALLKKLNDGGDTVPGVRYTVIATKYDEVVTPYTSCWLDGPNVRNVLLQDVYPADLSEHGAIIFDPMALREVMKQLDSASGVTADTASAGAASR
jgi:triacylglycerol esterase/lipase EstA (alpha/beta hydrolase family)